MSGAPGDRPAHTLQVGGPAINSQAGLFIRIGSDLNFLIFHFDPEIVVSIVWLGEGAGE